MIKKPIWVWNVPDMDKKTEALWFYLEQHSCLHENSVIITKRGQSYSCEIIKDFLNNWNEMKWNLTIG